MSPGPGSPSPSAEADPTPPLESDALEARPAKSTKKKSSGVRSLVERGRVIAGALLLAVVLRTFLLAAFYIPSGSMLDTLAKNDRVLVNKLSYKLHDVNRGDVVVFERPPNETDTSINDLI